MPEDLFDRMICETRQEEALGVVAEGDRHRLHRGVRGDEGALRARRQVPVGLLKLFVLPRPLSRLFTVLASGRLS